MTGRIQRRPRAREDIVEQPLHISETDPRAAERFQEALRQAERILADMPRLGRAAPASLVVEIQTEDT